jgi:hypothetical protein
MAEKWGTWAQGNTQLACGFNQTIRQSIIINLPSSRELACFIFLDVHNLQRISEASSEAYIFSTGYFKIALLWLASTYTDWFHEAEVFLRS